MGRRQRALENLVMNVSFWRDKRVLVTGHTGFKGGWLCLWLQQLGAKIIGYSLKPPSQPNLFESANVAKGMISLNEDVCNLAAVNAAVQSHKPEIIIHMAAQSLVRYSYNNPVETYATNVMGTVNVLESVRRSNEMRVALIITSDKCYENKERLTGYDELEPMGGYDPYSSSKGCAELVTAAYRKSYFNGDDTAFRPVAVASARAGNVIGGGDWAQDRLLPDIVRAFLQRQPVSIRHPQAIRPWQHVLEPLHGYLQLIELLWEQGSRYAGAWNFGADENDAKPVAWIVDRFAALWGDGARWTRDSSPQPHEANYLKLDCSKAKTQLGWHPRLTLASALEWSAEWYMAYQKGDDMRRFSIEQIKRYQGMTCG
jgi:CDP-glucose 4,6-dehydratase